MPRTKSREDLIALPAFVSRQCNDLQPRRLRANRTAWRQSGIPVGMSELEHFEILKDHAVFRPTGQVSVDSGAELVTTAIAFARARRIRKLLVDASNLTGFEPPGIAARYFYMHGWARAAGGYVRVAFLARPEMIDPQKFGRTVAANVGFTADVFTTEEDALNWLQRTQ